MMKMICSIFFLDPVGIEIPSHFYPLLNLISLLNVENISQMKIFWTVVLNMTYKYIFITGESTFYFSASVYDSHGELHIRDAERDITRELTGAEMNEVKRLIQEYDIFSLPDRAVLEESYFVLSVSVIFR